MNEWKGEGLTNTDRVRLYLAATGGATMEQARVACGLTAKECASVLGELVRRKYATSAGPSRGKVYTMSPDAPPRRERRTAEQRKAADYARCKARRRAAGSVPMTEHLARVGARKTARLQREADERAARSRAKEQASAERKAKERRAAEVAAKNKELARLAKIAAAAARKPAEAPEPKPKASVCAPSFQQTICAEVRDVSADVAAWLAKGNRVEVLPVHWNDNRSAA